jgi:hypothetical protein
MRGFDCADGSTFTAHDWSGLFVENAGEIYEAIEIWPGDVVRLKTNEIKEIVAAYPLPDKTPHKNQRRRDHDGVDPY